METFVNTLSEYRFSLREFAVLLFSRRTVFIRPLFCMSVLIAGSLPAFCGEALSGEGEPGALSLMAGEPAARKALVIGVRHYLPGIDEVPSAEKDVATFAEKLSAVGFTTETSLNETAEDVYRKLRKFELSIEPGDVALVYFSGHGFQSERANYLLTASTPKEITKDDLTSVTIPLDDIIYRLRQSGAGFSIIILDACRENQAIVEETNGQKKKCREGRFCGCQATCAACCGICDFDRELCLVL